MIQFSKLARPTQLSSDHGWVGRVLDREDHSPACSIFVYFILP